MVGLLAFALGVLLAVVVASVVPAAGLRLVLTGAAFLASLGLVTVLWVALAHRGRLAALGLRTRRPLADLGTGLLGGVGLYLGTTWVLAPLVFILVSLVSGGPVEPPRQEILPPDPSTLEITVGAVTAIVLAPIAEELFFRGFLFGALRARMRFLGAAAVSAVAFALVHVLPLLIPLMFVVGIGLAYLYERRGSLLTSMAAHAGFNVIGFVSLLGALT